MLEEQLGETIRKAGGSIDARGTITLPQAILFESNADKIKDPKFLTELCAPWLETLRSANLNISELKIEGHASSEGPRNYSAEQSYLYNLDLSQRRAQNALTICLGSTSEPEAQAWARDHLAAVGYSSARLITNIDGDEDRDASRRVMFSVALNQERLLDEIKKDLSGSSQPMMSARGPARIIDGDTIEISGTSYRLSGIDAPEMGQICVPKIGEPFDCGAWAHDKLTAIVAGREVQCKATESIGINVRLRRAGWATQISLSRWCLPGWRSRSKHIRTSMSRQRMLRSWHKKGFGGWSSRCLGIIGKHIDHWSLRTSKRFNGRAFSLSYKTQCQYRSREAMAPRLPDDGWFS